MQAEDDEVFKALADRNRRALLDSLRSIDGQTLTSLCDVLPDITRFGVMKHLAVLANAHLVVTRRNGREKLHYLNPVPIHQIYERWVSKFAGPHVAALTQLRRDIEQQQSTQPQRKARHASTPPHP